MLTRERIEEMKTRLAEFREARAATRKGPWFKRGMDLVSGNGFEFAKFGTPGDPVKQDEADLAFCVVARNSTIDADLEEALTALAAQAEAKPAPKK